MIMERTKKKKEKKSELMQSCFLIHKRYEHKSVLNVMVFVARQQEREKSLLGAVGRQVGLGL